jgi:membrane associated rhomboid family serine protease
VHDGSTSIVVLLGRRRMDRLLARLERRLGGYAIPNLILYVVGGMAIVWALAFTRPDVLGRLTLDMSAVRHGEVWRLVTFLFIPADLSYWVMINLYFTWWVGSSLEQHWGAFKLNAFYLLGALGTIVAALIAGGASNLYLDASLVLAFATVFPDVEILLFFILPIRVKWIGILTGAWLVFSFVMSEWSQRAAVVAAVGNYVLFFAGYWGAFLRSQRLRSKQRAKRDEFQASKPTLGQRACAICGAREAEGADIRVCTCEKCGAPRALCLEHARNH